jgi:hypothetical protein
VPLHTADGYGLQLNHIGTHAHTSTPFFVPMCTKVVHHEVAGCKSVA